MTAVETEIEILEGLDFEAEIPCIWPEHGNPAIWLLRGPCCDSSGTPCCCTCRQNWYRQEPDRDIRCSFCGVVSQAGDFTFEPLWRKR